MDIESLKSKWEKSRGASQNESEIEKMTRINQHPVLKRLRLKLLLEAALLILVLSVYRDWFDGASKPLYVNILLGISIVLYIVNDLLGYLAIRNPVVTENIKTSVKRQMHVLKRLAVFSLVSSTIYSTFLLVFLTADIDFTSSKYILLAGIGCTFLGILCFSFLQWRRRIRDFSAILCEFEEK